MKYRIETKEPFQVIGRTRNMTEANEFWHDIGDMWNQWNSACMTQKVGEKYSKEPLGYHFDVSLPTPIASDPKAFTYTIGCMYNGAKNEDNYDIVTMPGGKYAIFDIPEQYKDDVGEFMGKIIEYLQTEGYERAGVDVEYFKTVEWEEGKWEAWELIK